MSCLYTNVVDYSYCHCLLRAYDTCAKVPYPSIDLPIYLSVCLSIYLHAYIRTYVHTYVRTYIHTYMRTYVRKYVHTYIIHTFGGSPGYIYIYIWIMSKMGVRTRGHPQCGTPSSSAPKRKDGIRHTQAGSAKTWCPLRQLPQAEGDFSCVCGSFAQPQH